MSTATATAGHDAPAAAVDTPSLPKERGSKLVAMGGAAAGVGLLLCAAAGFTDPHRFAFSYLVGFSYVLTLGLGGLFFVVIQHLTRAGWSVGPRRQMEWLAGVLPLCAVLFIPIAVMAPKMYEWMDPEAAKSHEIAVKAGYLNSGFFYVRAVIYFLAWTGLSWFFRKKSAEQDVTGNPELTNTMQMAAAPSVAVFGLTLTFASFDWLMSLDPRWYSTIFGVYVFAGAAVSSFAVLALLTLWLHGNGLIKRVSHVEHRYDIGKFLFGFTVFWAYIAFSQYFLIWYANIPEETIFFRHRMVGSWAGWSAALVALQFVLPFVVLLARTMKRVPAGLALGAVIVLVGHYVDLYWLVMPTLDKTGVSFSWIDIAGLLGPVGVLVGWLCFRASKDNLYPLKDPRLAEAMALDNPL